MMNKWLGLSIEYANQRSYLDDLFQVYPTIPEGIREIDPAVWEKVERAFNQKNNVDLFSGLLQMDLFPVKDSYVAYFRRDPSAVARNPRTVNRICGRLYEMGLSRIHERCSEPKETNRQIGPMFKNWLRKGALGVSPVGLDGFLSGNGDAILDAGDDVAMKFAREHLNYSRDKGVDFIARFNKKYVIGEAKFLTDLGGHQNAQFDDAVATLESRSRAVKVAVLDGALYIRGNHKLHRDITEIHSDLNIMSALVLREFLYQL
jgi:hypothetical protein